MQSGQWSIGVRVMVGCCSQGFGLNIPFKDLNLDLLKVLGIPTNGGENW